MLFRSFPPRSARRYGVANRLMADSTNLRIGQLARAAGVTVETIRYYQRQGLLAEPPKPVRGIRVYNRQHLDRLLFIKRAQQLGFTLAEIAQLLSLSDGECSEVQELAKAKRVTVLRKLADLQRLDAVLAELIDACAANEDPRHCPVIDSLIPESDRGS